MNITRFGMQTVNPSIAVAIQSGGDGSSFVVPFRNIKEAKRYADVEESLSNEGEISTSTISEVYDTAEEYIRKKFSYDPEAMQERLDLLA